MAATSAEWTDEFYIHSTVDLDFVIGQQLGWPVGMMRSSPPEFRRRILAAAISYQLMLQSIDYAKRKYIDDDTYEDESTKLGDAVSDFIRNASNVLQLS